METLTHILASFDISQVILSAFPQILNPIIHAFQGMFGMLADVAGKLFESHPGIISGTMIFFLVYLTQIAFSTFKHKVALMKNKV